MKPGSPADHRQKIKAIASRRDYLSRRDREEGLKPAPRAELAALRWAIPWLWVVWQVEAEAIRLSIVRKEKAVLDPPNRDDFTNDRDYESAVDDFWLKVDAIEEASLERAHLESDQ